MTDPKHAHDTNQGRYYTDPAGGPDLVSVTNVLGTAVAKHALIPWAVKLTAEWAADHRLDVARRAVSDRDALLKEMKAQHREKRDAAADLGTRIHDRAQAVVLDQPFPADAEVDPYIRNLLRFFYVWGVDLEEDVVATEMTMLHRRLGYGGTGDLIVWLPTGPGGARELWLIDYKTSATRTASSVYPEYAMQLAALRFCQVLLLPDDTDVPVPPVQRTGILNLRQKSHALIPMPGDRAAHRAFRGALLVTQWLHQAPAKHPALPHPAAAPAGKAA